MSGCVYRRLTIREHQPPPPPFPRPFFLQPRSAVESFLKTALPSDLYAKIGHTAFIRGGKDDPNTKKYPANDLAGYKVKGTGGKGEMVQSIIHEANKE